LSGLSWRSEAGANRHGIANTGVEVLLLGCQLARSVVRVLDASGRPIRIAGDTGCGCCITSHGRALASVGLSIANGGDRRRLNEIGLRASRLRVGVLHNTIGREYGHSKASISKVRPLISSAAVIRNARAGQSRSRHARSASSIHASISGIRGGIISDISVRESSRSILLKTRGRSVTNISRSSRISPTKPGSLPSQTNEIPRSGRRLRIHRRKSGTSLNGTGLTGVESVWRWDIGASHVLVRYARWRVIWVASHLRSGGAITSGSVARARVRNLDTDGGGRRDADEISTPSVRVAKIDDTSSGKGGKSGAGISLKPRLVRSTADVKSASKIGESSSVTVGASRIRASKSGVAVTIVGSESKRGTLGGVGRRTSSVDR
jgi:AhpD family alkylhydroperoxidase